MITPADYWRYLFLPQLASALFLAAGLFLVRSSLFRPRPDLTALGRVFFAMPIGAFGAEHLVSGASMDNMIPDWIPFHTFWIYFVGAALLAAALSILSGKSIRLSSSLLGLMLLLFVAILHVPRLLANPSDRFSWAVLTRDFFFALGALTLAAPESNPTLAAVFRFASAPVLLFYAVEHFLHPDFAPGVPLELVSPAWTPLPRLWGFAIGALLLLSGLALLAARRARTALTALGAAVTLAVIVVYLPRMFTASTPAASTDAINYVDDTLLFAGAVFLLARSPAAAD